MKTLHYTFRGRVFTEEEIILVRKLVEQHFFKGRKGISRIICEELGWRQGNGRLKIVSCLEALRRMEAQGIVALPPANPKGGYRPIKLLS